MGAPLRVHPRSEGIDYSAERRACPVRPYNRFATATTACSLRTMTPTLTLTTAMQMLPRMAATSFEHRGPQCLLTLGRSSSPPLDQFSLCVCSCSPL